MNRHYKAILGNKKAKFSGSQMDIRWTFVQIDDLHRVWLCPKSRPIPPQHSPHSKLLKKGAHFRGSRNSSGQLYGNPLSHLTRYKLSPAFSWCTSSYGQWIGDWLSLGFINSILYNHLQIRMSVFQYILMVWFLGILICHWISRWRNSSLVEFLIRSHWRKLESAAVGEFILLHQLGW